ncbi:hypothetical protein DACRYDRAFT_77371 [Dacryopinax primogenitus]|uniref:Restriction of telomere capping protein 4 n=1 Tax=Dacryopinax primogenitus (strain DJM 731) TaxID=1858805 RepID=M5G627_DACPD|nr:uncharacterized protein DACRYDRAFT_77371 [Dacryopinax primogenitus]EJU03670.1 hypothetical protein DACRYDRAFT_77371 [Dacryopinax primogenitus]
MDLSSQTSQPGVPRGKKRESPKGKSWIDPSERVLKKSRLEDGGEKPALIDDEAEIPTGSLSSMRISSSPSPVSSGMNEAETKELCPFCDEPWPERPSKRLTELLKQVKPRAWKDPRYSNPDGLSAPLEIFVSLCTLHRSETSHIPEGIAQGWPTTLDFNRIPKRLEQRKDSLKAIISSPSASPFFQAAKNDIFEKGTRVAGSVFGQYETFERCQPGYYGEQGMITIQRALMFMFPNMVASNTRPLSVDDFIRQVLVPEAAILLIRQDLQLSRAKALQVLLKSRKYGLAQFPDRDGGETQWQDNNHARVHRLQNSPSLHTFPDDTISPVIKTSSTTRTTKRQLKPVKVDWSYKFRDNDTASSSCPNEESVEIVDITESPLRPPTSRKDGHGDRWPLGSSDEETFHLRKPKLR